MMMKSGLWRRFHEKMILVLLCLEILFRKLKIAKYYCCWPARAEEAADATIYTTLKLYVLSIPTLFNFLKAWKQDKTKTKYALLFFSFAP